MAKILIDALKERDEIKMNYEMGFITYQEFVEQMADTADYEQRKMISFYLNAVLESPEVLELKRRLQEEVDSRIANHEVISALISSL